MNAVKCLGRTEAQDLVRHCLKDGYVVLSRHFKDELANDRLDTEDALYILRHGHILREPELDIKTGEWKYRLEGRTPDGIRIAVVFSFKRVDMCFLITIFTITS